MPDWSPLPRIDFCVAAGSVPRFLRRTREAFPRRDAYYGPNRRGFSLKPLAATPA